MARSLSHAARLAAAISDAAGAVLTRRSYSAAAAPSARRAEEKAATAAAGKGKKVGGAAETSWVPDPVTGYYRPANRVVELDAAELRQRLLSRRFHK